VRGKGINYDTGARLSGGWTREAFDSSIVRREMQVIADDLHCTAVRISGSDPGRLAIAGEHAADLGLEVWFAPFPCELTAEQMLPLFADCAARAEDLRRHGADVVLVAGGELSIFARGFLPGDDLFARTALLTTPGPDLRSLLSAVPARLNAFLRRVRQGQRELEPLFQRPAKGFRDRRTMVMRLAVIGAVLVVGGLISALRSGWPRRNRPG
jgi:hypothetical protein